MLTDRSWLADRRSQENYPFGNNHRSGAHWSTIGLRQGKTGLFELMLKVRGVVRWERPRQGERTSLIDHENFTEFQVSGGQMQSGVHSKLDTQ